MVRVRFRVRFRVRVRVRVRVRFRVRVRVRVIKLSFRKKYMAPSTEYLKRSHSRGIAIFSYPLFWRSILVLLMLENRVAATGSKDKIVDR